MKKKPIDEAFVFMCDNLKDQGFNKLTKRIMVKETDNWIFFFQFTSILKPCNFARNKDGYLCEVGAFLKGASHYSGYNGEEYNGYPVKDVSGCHFHRSLKPPFLLASRECKGAWSTLLWKYTKNKNLQTLLNDYVQKIPKWMYHLENLEEVKNYLLILDDKGREAYDREKWGDSRRSKDFLDVLNRLTDDR